jgi:hypothetical protein
MRHREGGTKKGVGPSAAVLRRFVGSPNTDTPGRRVRERLGSQLEASKGSITVQPQ